MVGLGRGPFGSLGLCVVLFAGTRHGQIDARLSLCQILVQIILVKRLPTQQYVFP